MMLSRNTVGVGIELMLSAGSVVCVDLGESDARVLVGCDLEDRCEHLVRVVLVYPEIHETRCRPVSPHW